MDTIQQCQELTAKIELAIMHQRDRLAAIDVETTRLIRPLPGRRALPARLADIGSAGPSSAYAPALP